MSHFASSYRTHTCGELRGKHVGRQRTVKLSGFVAEIVDPRTLYLRDNHGRTLITIADDADDYVSELFSRLGPEHIIQVTGRLAKREAPEVDTPTGEIFIEVTGIEHLSDTDGVPDGVVDGAPVEEEERLLYRQLYLRRDEMQRRLALRSKIVFEIREFLVANQFLELQTPQLFWYDAVATEPEPVPVGDGKAFALPSGPVVWDQYLKPGHFDRFFQFVRITRRETPTTPMHTLEYTGLDINMAYVEREDFCVMIEGLITHLAKAILGLDLPNPFPSFSYRQAMSRFGTDNPFEKDDTDGEKPIRPVWVHSYPFLRPDEEGNFVPDVVVFSKVVEDDLKTALVDPDDRNEVHAEAFDLVINGLEIASAYMGNHNIFLQRQLWQNLFQLGVDDFIRVRAPIEAFRFAVPPHGGINIGFDRLVAVLLDIADLKEVMFYPKNDECEDPMLGSPGPIPAEAVEDIVADAPTPDFTEEDYLKEVLES